MQQRRPDLEMMDRALLDLRRFITAPRVLQDQGRPVDLSTLLVLDGLPHEGESVRATAERLHVAPSTASRFVTRAEDAGMVTRCSSHTDTRQTLVVATKKGRDLAATAAEFRLGRLQSIVGDWDDDEVTAFALALHRFAGGEEFPPGTGDSSAEA